MNVKLNSINDKTMKITKLEINIFLSFLGFFETSVAIALGKDKLDKEIIRIINGFTNENNPIASTPRTRFINILDNKEINFALVPKISIFNKYNV